MSTITDYLTGIADAIRIKKGTSATIPAQNFATEIKNLNTGGITPNGIINSYYAYAGENISAGDFVEFINGKSGQSQNVSITPLTISSTSQTTNNTVQGILLDNNRVAIIYCSGSGGDYDSRYFLKGVICTITDTGIVASTPQVLETTVMSGYWIQLTQISENSFLITHNHPYNSAKLTYAFIRTCLVTEDNRFILGEDIEFDTTSSITYTSATKVSANKYVIGVASNGYTYLATCTLDGLSMNLSTITRVYTSPETSIMQLCTLDSNKFLLLLGAYGTNNTSIKEWIAVVGIVENDVISLGTKLSFHTNSSTIGAIKQGLSLLFALSSTKVFVVVTSSSKQVYGYILNIQSDNTIVANSKTLLFTSLASGITTGMQLGDKFVVLGDSTVANKATFHIITINNDVITVDNTISTDLTYDTYGYRLIPLSNQSFAYIYPVSNSSFNVGALNIDFTNNNIVSDILLENYEKQVKKATDSINGIAKTSGTGGTETQHNQQVSVYSL